MNERKESLVATNGSDTVYPAKGHIVKIKFNNGKELDINKNDIVIFVGPNNAGKSQSLSDIYQLAKNKVPTIVVSDIEVSKEGSLKQLLEATSKKDYNGNYIQYTALNHIVSYGDGHTENYFSKNQYYGEYRNWFVTKLDTQARLSLCFPARYIRRDEPKTNPIHYAAFDKQYRKWLSGRFKQAFGTNIIPNTQFGAEIPLCLGDPVKLEDTFSDEQERQEAYADILETYKQVQDQGDGIKSFTGILLSLMLNYYCTYLIDEPESFLHPPQARIMGQIIGETLSDNQQAFISTHSEDVIKGLLEACTDRLKIVRITRYDDTNDFSILDNQKVKEIFGDPLLKYSNIMSSLFHNVVVLCESDSDCKLYSVIDSILKQEEGKYSETLFLHCGGKHRMARTASALLALDIDVRLIPDMDVMNDETVFKSIVETFGIDWNSIRTDYNILVSNLHSTKERIFRADAKTAINQILDAKQGTELSKKEIEIINNAIRTVSKWDNIKHSGETIIPAGDATNAYKRLKKELVDHKIYLVPVGELEGFVKEVGRHGPDWVNDVLEAYPDLSSDVYNQVKDFIRSIGL